MERPAPRRAFCFLELPSLRRTARKCIWRSFRAARFLIQRRGPPACDHLRNAMSIVFSALVAVFVGFAASVAVILQAAQALGATPG